MSRKMQNELIVTPVFGHVCWKVDRIADYGKKTKACEKSKGDPRTRLSMPSSGGDVVEPQCSPC